MFVKFPSHIVEPIDIDMFYDELYDTMLDMSSKGDNLLKGEVRHYCIYDIKKNNQLKDIGKAMKNLAIVISKYIDEDI
jgi:hypothetical protein